MTKNIQLSTEFLNVNLDIYSDKDLSPLVNALGKGIHVLFLGRHKRTWETHLELSKHPIKSPNSAILDFCKLLSALPPEARRLWDGSKTRQFNIGIQSGTDQPSYWSVINAETIKSVAELNSSIALTIYPAHMEIFEKPTPPDSSDSHANNPSQD